MEQPEEIPDEVFEDSQNANEPESAPEVIAAEEVVASASQVPERASFDSTAIGNALVDHLQPQATLIRKKLEQVLQHQTVLEESVTNERSKLENSAALRELERTFVRVEQYRAKLVAIRQTMHSVRERVDRMRARAVKLSNAKKAELERAQRAKQAEIERDRSLAPLVPAAIRERRPVSGAQNAASATQNETSRS